MHACILKAWDPEQAQVHQCEQEKAVGKQGGHVRSPYRADQAPDGRTRSNAEAQIEEEPGTDRLVLVVQVGLKGGHELN